MEFFQRQIFEYNGAMAAREQITLHWSNTVDMWPEKQKSDAGSQKPEGGGKAK